MAATDYEIVAGWRNAYFARKKKQTKTGPKTMSADRRVIEDDEIFALMEFCLRKRYEETGKPTLEIKTMDGKRIFEATLLDTD